MVKITMDKDIFDKLMFDVSKESVPSGMALRISGNDYTMTIPPEAEDLILYTLEKILDEGRR